MKKSVGILLIALACVCWLSLIFIPFLSISLASKGGLVTAAIILGEVFFWLGTLFLGKQLVERWKGHALFSRRSKKS